MPPQVYTNPRISTVRPDNRSDDETPTTVGYDTQELPGQQYTPAIDQQGTLEKNTEAELRVWRSELAENCRAIHAKLTRQMELEDLISTAELHLIPNGKDHESCIASGNQDLSEKMPEIMLNANHLDVLPNTDFQYPFPEPVPDQTNTSNIAMEANQTAYISMPQESFHPNPDLGLDLLGTSTATAGLYEPQKNRQGLIIDTLENPNRQNSDNIMIQPRESSDSYLDLALDLEGTSTATSDLHKLQETSQELMLDRPDNSNPQSGETMTQSQEVFDTFFDLELDLEDATAITDLHKPQEISLAMMLDTADHKNSQSSETIMVQPQGRSDSNSDLGLDVVVDTDIAAADLHEPQGIQHGMTLDALDNRNLPSSKATMVQAQDENKKKRKRISNSASAKVDELSNLKPSIMLPDSENAFFQAWHKPAAYRDRNRVSQILLGQLSALRVTEESQVPDQDDEKDPSRPASYPRTHRWRKSVGISVKALREGFEKLALRGEERNSHTQCTITT